MKVVIRFGTFGLEIAEYVSETKKLFRAKKIPNNNILLEFYGGWIKKADAIYVGELSAKILSIVNKYHIARKRRERKIDKIYQETNKEFGELIQKLKDLQKGK